MNEPDGTPTIEEDSWDEGLRAAFGAPEPRPPTLTPAEEGLRFRVSEEIGTGGMGIVRRARDLDLDRDVAMKILRDDCVDDPDVVRRFLREARIGGRLQHPGVVPIHQVGVDEEKRPYFTMKLVRGRTLAALLAEREDPGRDRVRLLRIFEQVCQTVSYAHSRSVVHGDLKPANVMVGAFGEVQVLDWGVAREIGGERDVGTPVTPAAETTDVDTQIGIVSGTPAYMAPEQAQGLVTAIDERTDVFALGGMLCEILTGRPPYPARQGAKALLRAIEADLDDARLRLEAAGADREMASLAAECLQPDMDDRPRDAAAVAARISSFLTSIEERAREAEIAAARDAGRAQEERRAHRLTRILAGLIVAVVIAVGVTAFSIREAGRERARRAELRVTTILEDIAAQAGQEDWSAVTLTAGRATELLIAEIDVLDPAVAETLRGRIDGYAATARDATATARLSEIRGTDLDDADVDAAYSEAFRDMGLEVDALSPEEIGAALRARGDAAATFALALDDWAARRRGRRHGRDGGRVHLLRCAQAADPDPARNALREALIEKNADALRGFADRAEELPPATLQLLGPALARSGEPEIAARVLEDGVRRHPGDYGLNFELARTYAFADRAKDAELYVRICIALRPASGHPRAFLGMIRLRAGKTDEAVTTLRTAVELTPDSGFIRYALARALREAGREEEAVAIERTLRRKGRGGGPDGRTEEFLDALSGQIRSALETDEAGKPCADRAERLERARKMIAWALDRRTGTRGPADRPEHRDRGRRLLEKLRSDPRFAGVRDESSLAALTEEEREGWVEIWRRIDERILKSSVRPEAPRR